MSGKMSKKMSDELELARLKRLLQMKQGDLLFGIFTVIVFGGMFSMLAINFAAFSAGNRLPVATLLLLILFGGVALALHKVRETWADWRRLRDLPGRMPQG